MKTLESSSELELLRQKMAALEARMAQLSPRLEPTASGSNFASPTNRRGMMKKIAGLAVGVATVGLLRPGRTLASTGSAILMGQFNQPTTSVATVLGNVGTTLASVVFVGANTTSAGFTPPSLENIGIAGLASGDSTTSNTMVGLYGLALNTGGPGHGVLGNGPTSGVFGTSDSGYGGRFEGGRAALALSPGVNAIADPNAGVIGVVGNVYCDSSSGLWYKAGGSVPYCRLADSTTAGALTAFAVSSRFVNTITGSGNTYAGQSLNGGATATYQIGGVTVSGNTVPANARAIIGRIADPNPTGPGGNILVGAANPPVGGVIAIVAGAPQNSSFISALDATGKLYVKNTSASGSTDIIIDIQGYYL